MWLRDGDSRLPFKNSPILRDGWPNIAAQRAAAGATTLEQAQLFSNT